jgi:hypothetical protein
MEKLKKQNQDSPAKARYPSGKGEVCKTFMRRFDPDPRLQFFNNLADSPNDLVAKMVVN